MSLKGIIFDMDGVICSTDNYHYLAWKALADRLAIPFDRDCNNLLRGVSRIASLEIILGRSDKSYTQEEKEAFANEKNYLYLEYLKEMSPADLTDDVFDTLNTLRSKKLKLAIGSSSKNAPFILERLGLGSYFDAVADGNCITRSKPDPEVFLMAAEMMGLAPADCIVVEDAHAGVEASVAGGFKVAVIGDAVDDERAAFRLHTFSDLLKTVNLC